MNEKTSLPYQTVHNRSLCSPEEVKIEVTEELTDIALLYQD